MRKIIIITLKVLAVLFLVFGIVASIGLSTMSMRGMMRYFVEAQFNVTAFVATLFMTILTSASLYGFAILIEIQEESLQELKGIKRMISNQNDLALLVKDDVSTIRKECVETNELENDIANALKYEDKPDDIDDEEIEIIEEIQSKE